MGIVGFGRIGGYRSHSFFAFINHGQRNNVGQYLYDEIRKMSDYEVAFVWNRSLDKMEGVVEEKLILPDLDDFASR